MGDLIVKEPENEMAEQIEPGNYQGVCHRYVDLGTHHVDYTFESKHIVGDYHKVQITWEIPDERIEITRDGEKLDLPRVISKEYNLTLGKKSNLRKDLQSWRGRDFTKTELEGFSLKNILKANAVVNILHNEKGYAYVAAVTPLMKNMAKKEPENPVIGFSIDNDGFDNIPELPEWIETKIKNSLEYGVYEDKPTGTFEPETPDPYTEDGDPGYSVEDDIPF